MRLVMCLVTPRRGKLAQVLIDFSLTVKAATLISGGGQAISYVKEEKIGFIYNL